MRTTLAEVMRAEAALEAAHTAGGEEAIRSALAGLVAIVGQEMATHVDAMIRSEAGASASR